MSFTESLIGRGMKYPLQVDPSGKVSQSLSFDRINQSIQIILDTPKGDRLLMPEFGSRIQYLRFDPLDKILMDKIDQYVREDLREWEKRIIVTRVEFQDSPDLRDRNILMVKVHYKLINSDIDGNYVYPFKYGPRPLHGERSDM